MWKEQAAKSKFYRRMLMSLQPTFYKASYGWMGIKAIGMDRNLGCFYRNTPVITT